MEVDDNGKKVKNELYLFAKELENTLNFAKIEAIGKDCGFVKRKSKLTTKHLVILCGFTNQKISIDSLELYPNLTQNCV